MFNVDGKEFVFLVLIALVVLGPEKLPDLFRRMGKAYSEFRRLSEGFQEEFRKAVEEPTTQLKQTSDLIRESADLRMSPDSAADDTGVDDTGPDDAVADDTGTDDSGPDDAVADDSEPDDAVADEPEANATETIATQTSETGPNTVESDDTGGDGVSDAADAGRPEGPIPDGNTGDEDADDGHQIGPDAAEVAAGPAGAQGLNNDNVGVEADANAEGPDGDTSREDDEPATPNGVTGRFALAPSASDAFGSSEGER